MTPIRETIAGAIYASFAGGTSDETLDDMATAIAQSGADAVLRALDEAGLVVVPKTMSDAVAWAICPIVQDEAGFVCKQCPATVEHNGKSGVMGCRGHCADIYRAMIAASVVE